MSIPQRPAPPLRSYTETVQADVDDATSSSLFHLSLAPTQSSPPRDPTTFATSAAIRRARAPTLGSGDQLRRRRSNEENRLPPATDLSWAAADSSPDAVSAESTSRFGVHTAIRRANSTDLLSLVPDGQDSEASDAGFSSEVSVPSLRERCLERPAGLTAYSLSRSRKSLFASDLPRSPRRRLRSALLYATLSSHRPCLGSN